MMFCAKSFSRFFCLFYSVLEHVLINLNSTFFVWVFQSLPSTQMKSVEFIVKPLLKFIIIDRHVYWARLMYDFKSHNINLLWYVWMSSILVFIIYTLGLTFLFIFACMLERTQIEWFGLRWLINFRMRKYFKSYRLISERHIKSFV